MCLCFGGPFHQSNFINIPLSDEFYNPWLSEYIRQCGEVVDISVNNNNGGWNNLLAFAHDRERQNMGAFVVERSKRRVHENCKASLPY